MRRSWLAAGIVVATLLALAAQTSIVTRTGFFAGDFRAFYCAARVASQGADPYQTQPLGGCERSVGSDAFFRKNPGVTIPAPLPGYAIAALIPLAQLPYAIAVACWLGLLLLAWLACVLTLARFARVQWETALGAFALSLGTLSLPFGEVVPLAVACTCLAGYWAWRGRAPIAALFAAGAMVEPHLGLPVCVALAVWLPATRVVLAICAVALAALSLGVLGAAANIEYFASVLPAHALSELTRDTQYSLSAVLAALDVAPGAAVKAGSIWYFAMLIAGTIVAGRLARQTGNNAFLACVPPAFAVFGGTFIHVTQIAAAVPAAVLLVTYAENRYRNAAIVALLLLAVPWGWVVSPALLVAPLFPVAFLAWWYWREKTVLVLLTAITAALLVFGLQSLPNGPHLGAQVVAAGFDPRLPEGGWSAFSRSGSTGSLAAWAVRIPTWIALGLLLGTLIAQARALRVRRENVVAGTLALACTIVPIALQFNADRASGWLAVDFRAYYCAALAQRERTNPYFAQSLHPCESTTAAPYFRVPANVTVPAPYPPYVMAALAPLTFLRFEDAVVMWWSLIAGALAFAVYALARLSSQPWMVAVGALGLSAGLTSFSTGNMLPLGLAAVVVAALFVQRGQLMYGVVAIALAMVEPQIALPAALAGFIAFPAARLALVLAGALLGAISLLAAGVPQTIAYVTTVLPAHALAEVSRDNQYSLAAVLTAAGVPDTTAVLFGSISYVVMLAIGVLVALRLARRYDEPALVLLIPPAFSLLGGSFVHTAEIAAAVPAALLLYMRAVSLRAWLFAAFVLLAVPWLQATSIVMFLAPFFPVAYLVYVLWRQDRTLALGTALLAFITIGGLFVLAAQPHAAAAALPHAHPPIDPRLAEASWRDLVLSNTTNRPIMWLLRLPTWGGLLLLAGSALALTRKPRLVLAAQSP